MKILLLAVFVLSCTAANAQLYKCPQLYPGSDAGTTSLPLTNASVYWGELHGNGALVGGDVAVEDGVEARYGLPEGEQGWLVCRYGGRKRVKGRVHDGHEWGQYMISGNREWWVKLAPNVTLCTVAVREVKSRDRSFSTWMATAACK